MMVNSSVLERIAQTLRAGGYEVRTLSNDVPVSPDQLEAAARILRDGERCVITSPRRLASDTELPGFIELGSQDPGHPEVLVFNVGIFTGLVYRIDRHGTVL